VVFVTVIIGLLAQAFEHCRGRGQRIFRWLQPVRFSRPRFRRWNFVLREQRVGSRFAGLGGETKSWESHTQRTSIGRRSSVVKRSRSSGFIKLRSHEPFLSERSTAEVLSPERTVFQSGQKSSINWRTPILHLLFSGDQYRLENVTMAVQIAGRRVCVAEESRGESWIEAKRTRSDAN
jgi:hypothetical protein